MRVIALFLMLLWLATVSLADENLELKNALYWTKQELSQKDYKRDYNIYKMYERMIKSLPYKANSIFNSKTDARFIFLERLSDIQKNSGSIIISQYLLNKAILLGQTQNRKAFKKYIYPSAELLYKNGICDGFSFIGDYQLNVLSDKKTALKTYNRGVKACKLDWKSWEILSKRNALKYGMGKVER